MALARDLMHVFTGSQATALGGSLKSGISAAGTAITDATDLTASKNVVSTATEGQGVQLTSMNAGESQVVFNATGVSIKVYPSASTVAINQLAVGVGATLGPYTTCEFHQVSSTQVLGVLSA